MSSLRMRRNHLLNKKRVLIAKSQPLQFQDLAINPEPSIPQNPNPSRKKES
jgi:hypothetical protein